MSPHRFIFNLKPDMFCPLPRTFPTSPPLPSLLQPHSQPAGSQACEHTPISGSPYILCLPKPCGSSQPFRCLFLREAPLNGPSKRSMPSHPPNYSISLSYFILSHTYHSPYYTAYFLYWTPPLSCEFHEGRDFDLLTESLWKLNIWHKHWLNDCKDYVGCQGTTRLIRANTSLSYRNVQPLCCIPETI